MFFMLCKLFNHYQSHSGDHDFRFEKYHHFLMVMSTKLLVLRNWVFIIEGQ